MDIITVRNGEQLYVEGKPTSSFYIIISGEFRTTKKLIT
jgi:CRP-like cAMP-binding protein